MNELFLQIVAKRQLIPNAKWACLMLAGLWPVFAEFGQVVVSRVQSLIGGGWSLWAGGGFFSPANPAPGIGSGDP